MKEPTVENMEMMENLNSSERKILKDSKTQ